MCNEQRLGGTTNVYVNEPPPMTARMTKNSGNEGMFQEQQQHRTTFVLLLCRPWVKGTMLAASLPSDANRGTSVDMGSADMHGRESLRDERQDTSIGRYLRTKTASGVTFFERVDSKKRACAATRKVLRITSPQPCLY